MSDESIPKARMLAGYLEPIVGSVYFAPECHQRYAALGFNASAAKAGGVELPDGPAYFTSRGSCLGQVPGELVASAFAVFNPAAVVPSVSYGWTLTDAPTIATARTEGAVAQLERILGPEPEGLDRATELLRRATEPLRPEGRPLYSGLLSLGLPGTPMGDFWRLGDYLREFRGDSHTAAWVAFGIDATEIGLLTELFIGLPMRSYIRTARGATKSSTLPSNGCRAEGCSTRTATASPTRDASCAKASSSPPICRWHRRWRPSVMTSTSSSHCSHPGASRCGRRAGTSARVRPTWPAPAAFADAHGLTPTTRGR